MYIDNCVYCCGSMRRGSCPCGMNTPFRKVNDPDDDYEGKGTKEDPYKSFYRGKRTNKFGYTQFHAREHLQSDADRFILLREWAGVVGLPVMMVPATKEWTTVWNYWKHHQKGLGIEALFKKYNIQEILGSTSGSYVSKKSLIKRIPENILKNPIEAFPESIRNLIPELEEAALLPSSKDFQNQFHRPSRKIWKDQDPLEDMVKYTIDLDGFTPKLLRLPGISLEFCKAYINQFSSEDWEKLVAEKKNLFEYDGWYYEVKVKYWSKGKKTFYNNLSRAYFKKAKQQNQIKLMS